MHLLLMRFLIKVFPLVLWERASLFTSFPLTTLHQCTNSIKIISSWHWITEFTMLVESAKVKFTRKKMGFLQFLKPFFQPFSCLLWFSSFSHSLCFPLGCDGRSSQDSKLEPHHQQKTDFLDFAATSTSQILLQNILKMCSFTFYLAHFLSFLGLQILELLVREDTCRVWKKSMGSISDLTNTFVFEILFWGICSCSFQNYKHHSFQESERMFTPNFWFQNRIRINFFQCREVIESDLFSTLMKASSYGCSMSDIWSCFLSHIMELVSNQNSKNISMSMCWNWFEFVSIVMDSILFLTTSWSRLTKSNLV